MVDTAHIVGVKEPPSAKQQKYFAAFLKDKFSDMSLEEIKSAVDMMMSGELDVPEIHKQTKITPIWWSTILRAYKMARGKHVTKYKTGVALLDAADKSNISEEAKLDIMARGSIKLFESYSSHGEFQDIANGIYLFLRDKGFITYTKADGQEFLKLAQTKLVERHKDRKAKMKPSEKDYRQNLQKRQLEVLISTLESNIEEKPILIEARKIALKSYFDDLIKNKKNLDELKQYFIVVNEG